MAQTPSSVYTYDVFLSFRGEDTRYGFTGSLYKALDDSGIRTFIDDVDLQRGDSITPSLITAIENSRTAIIVFSKNYASSSFCLDELVNIIASIKEKGRLVLPVFYYVDPSHVRHQRRSYHKALALHEERFKDDMDKVQKWRKALRQAADLSGHHFKLGDGYEYQFIERIIKDVSIKINPAPLHESDYLVGMDSRVQKVIELLDISSDRVHMVGIHGIGGIGKTTLAWEVYNSIAVHFESVCFLERVRENLDKFGLRYLQDMLLSKLTGKKDIIFTSVIEGISEIKKRLHQKKVLLILDDVNAPQQLRAMVGGPDWFGPGSRVIITTRDKPLLAIHGVESIYDVDELNNSEALELLRWKLFKSNVVDPSFNDILNRVVVYACGLPLALEVIGSNLSQEEIDDWKSALDDYERIPHEDIQKILQVSYHDLKVEEKSVFLDIACCFRGYQLREVEDILRAHHDNCMKRHIGKLVKKSLIKISKDGEVTLHDLIEDMGKEIVRQESLKEPGKRSRLWFHEDIVQVLEDNMGTSNIEIIYLHFPKFEGRVNWDGKAFMEMKYLKTLIIRNGHFSEGPKQLPKSLRVLEWWGFPSLSLPSNFDPTELALFRLPHSSLESVQLPKSLKVFKNLRVLDFSRCEFITEIHDVSAAPNLEEISFQGCENLIKIDKSIGFLHNLKMLDAFGCRKLMSFPSLKLTSLEKLDLSYCSSLESFPEILGGMENLAELNLSGCSLLQEIRGIPSNIESFQAERCTSLKQLDLRFLPACTEECSFLRRLILDDCRNLHEIRGIPSNLEYLSAGNCKALAPQCRSTLMNEVLYEAGGKEFCLPGTTIPEWFDHQSKELQISFWFRNKLPAISLCFVARHSSSYSFEWHRLVLIINGKRMSPFVFKCPVDNIVILNFIFNLKGMNLDDNVAEVLLQRKWNHVVFCFDSDSEPDHIKTGLHVHEQKCSMEDIRFYHPYSISATLRGGSISPFTSRFTYDVFISFQGVDYLSTYDFTDELCLRLRQRGFRIFRGDEILQRGPSCITAIENSGTAIIVFSHMHASSSFWLDALVHVIACIKDKDLLVLPVFYDVDPSDVRHQQGSYKKSLTRHKKRFKDDTEKLQKWRTALRQAADLSGFHLKLGDGYEHEFLERIIIAVYNKVTFGFHDADGLVQMESRVLQVMELVDISSDGVHMVGIQGIGGIVKTTLADVVFQLIAHDFDCCCFLPNVRIESYEKGLKYLQEKLLSEIVQEKTIELKSVDEGISMIQQMLCKKKVLLILDDVDKIEQLEAMVGGSSWFGPGSRVIITTLDKQLLARHGVERTYEVCSNINLLPSSKFFESCESVNEAKGKGMAECNTNDGEDNGWSPVMKLLPMTKVRR